MPAAMGIGLALVGCSGSSSSGRVDAAADGRGGTDSTSDRSNDLTPSGPDGSPAKLDSSNDTAITRLDVPKDSTARDVPADAPPDAPGADRRQPDNARSDAAIDRSIGRQDTAIDRPADRQDTGSDGAVTDGGRD
jgi:hypothetical protein